jgi:hypothetical protein
MNKKLPKDVRLHAGLNEQGVPAFFTIRAGNVPVQLTSTEWIKYLDYFGAGMGEMLRVDLFREENKT